MPALSPPRHRTTGMPVQASGRVRTLRSGLLLEGIAMNYARRLCSGLCVVSLVWLNACTVGKPYVNLANYLHSEQGFSEWKKGEEQLEKGVVAAAAHYQRDPSMANLQQYEKAVRDYLDHGYILYQAYGSTSYEPPADLLASLEKRTDELMDVADAYLKQGSIPMGIGIAREVVLKYTALQVMDRAQHRAEGVLMEYYYERNY